MLFLDDAALVDLAGHLLLGPEHANQAEVSVGFSLSLSVSVSGMEKSKCHCVVMSLHCFPKGNSQLSQLKFVLYNELSCTIV